MKVLSRNINTDRLFEKGRALILACDQGLEHGPKDFNEHNIDPGFIMELALEGHYTAVAVQPGIAEKYYGLHYKDVPLIVKVNGKTNLSKEDPVSLQHTSVNYALKIGASAIGYTLYLGTKDEQRQIVELGKIIEEAHTYGIPVMVWNYPRGSNIKDPLSTDTIAYGTRVALELGADIIKLKYNGDKEGFKWILKCAGRAKVVISGGSKQHEHDFLQKLYDVIDAGAHGVAVGRNAWQHNKPYAMSRAMRDILFSHKNANEAMKRFG